MNRILLSFAIVSFIILVVFIGASPQSTNRAQPIQLKAESSHPAEEVENIAEVVFRWQLLWNKQQKVCLLLLNGREPSEKFISRFVGQTEPRIQKSSLTRRDIYGRVVDAKTGEVAEIISISPITWISDTEVDVRSNVYDGYVIECVHRLTYKDGKWVIKDWYDLEWEKTTPINVTKRFSQTKTACKRNSQSLSSTVWKKSSAKARCSPKCR